MRRNIASAAENFLTRSSAMRRNDVDIMMYDTAEHRRSSGRNRPIVRVPPLTLAALCAHFGAEIVIS